jgi:hypothetical protein
MTVIWAVDRTGAAFATVVSLRRLFDKVIGVEALPIITEVRDVVAGGSDIAAVGGDKGDDVEQECGLRTAPGLVEIRVLLREDLEEAELVLRLVRLRVRLT